MLPNRTECGSSALRLSCFILKLDFDHLHQALGGSAPLRKSEKLLCNLAEFAPSLESTLFVLLNFDEQLDLAYKLLIGRPLNSFPPALPLADPLVAARSRVCHRSLITVAVVGEAVPGLEDGLQGVLACCHRQEDSWTCRLSERQRQRAKECCEPFS